MGVILVPLNPWVNLATLLPSTWDWTANLKVYPVDTDEDTASMLLTNPSANQEWALLVLIVSMMDSFPLQIWAVIPGKARALMLAGVLVSTDLIVMLPKLIFFLLDGGVGGLQGNNAAFADLAQAQAQLQSLQQFRAAAGGHHHKMASFSFPNMLPNMMAANMMGLGLGGVNLLQQQQQQFQSQLQQQSTQPQRKSLFAPYLPQASLPPLLAAGKLVVGILRVNKRNRSDAYVATEVLDADIYICGSKDRNRALEGDIVAVELLDVDEVWGTKKEKEEKKRKKEENAAYDSRSGRKDDKKKDDVEVEGQGLMLFEDEEYV